MTRQTPRLVLFDIDGTLLRASGAGREAKRAAMLDIFGTADGIEAHQFGGKTDWYSLLEMLASKGYDAEAIRTRLPEFARTMGQHLTRIIGQYEVHPCLGALEVVTALQARSDVVIGIVTGNLHTTAPVKLRAAGFDPAWFAIGAYGSEAVNRDDLPPLAIRRAAALTGYVFTPQDVVVVGDTPADVQSAHALGAVSVAVETGYSSHEALLESRPDYLLPDLTQLPGVLRLSLE